MTGSARHFDIPCSADRLRASLDARVQDAGQALRVRLLVNRDGTPRVEAFPLEPPPGPLRVALAAAPIDPADPFFFHKTTRRGMLEAQRLAGYDDTVLWNPDRDITETIIANIVVDRGDRRVTPPVACGLLAGTMRAELLARREISEERVSVDEFQRAPRFWLINSVRGWMQAVLDRPL